jgi:hypothetical protein
MVYTPKAGRTLLFGGVDKSTYYGDTWEWDGDGWVQISDIGPSPRASACVAYDTVRDVAVLFGGYASTQPVYDTWEWDGSAWTQIEDAGPQVSAYRCGMVYDAARAVTLLESGSLKSGGGGTWTWDGSAWLQVEDLGPPRRDFYALAFDPVRGRGVVFGGDLTGNLQSLASDTWEWDGTVWAKVQDTGPTARAAHYMSWDGESVLLFGGVVAAPSSGSVGLGDTWAWDGKHWQQRQDIGPSKRGHHKMTWDSTRNRTILFGGCSNWVQSPTPGQLYGDTWEAFQQPQPT